MPVNGEQCAIGDLGCPFDGGNEQASQPLAGSQDGNADLQEIGSCPLDAQ